MRNTWLELNGLKKRLPNGSLVEVVHNPDIRHHSQVTLESFKKYVGKIGVVVGHYPRNTLIKVDFDGIEAYFWESELLLRDVPVFQF